jgi:serine/threonine protein kinase
LGWASAARSIVKESEGMVEGGSHSAAGVREGDILADKYRVERVLGIGGMGVVVAAHHIQLDEKVALKFLLPEALGNSDAVARFAREARAAAKIKSEHVARVRDVGTLPNGAPYMVMEYLDGEDLASLLDERGPLPVEQAVEFVIQACEAVGEAHALGIVHRDLKPSNLFCVRRADGRPSIKVLDFGISKASGASAAETWVTATRAKMGSPLYMSPEQMVSAKYVDGQTDIWAIGVILFELMAGRPPFRGDSIMEIANKIAHVPAPSLRSIRFDVPSGLEAIVFKCLEKDRLQRYPNVANLALELLPFAPRRMRASVERIFGTTLSAADLSESARVMPPSSRMTSTPPVGRSTPPPGAHNKAAVGAGLAGAAMVMAVVSSVFLLHRANTEHRDSQARGIDPPSPAVSEQLPPADPRRPPETRPVDTAGMVPVVPETGPAPVTLRGDPAMTRTNPLAPAPAIVATHTHPVHPAAIGRVPPVPSASVASSENSGEDPVRLRSAETRPKVQLERDNPWP